MTARTSNGIDAQHLGDAGDEHVVRALADLGRAAEGGHARPSDRAAAARPSAAARSNRSAAPRRTGRSCRRCRAPRPSPAAWPRRSLPARRRARPPRCSAPGPSSETRSQFAVKRIARHGVVDAPLRRVDVERRAILSICTSRREARLRRAVAALGSAGRLVGEGAAAAEAVARDLVGDRLQRAGVEGRGHAVAAVGAAVEQRLQLLPDDFEPLFGFSNAGSKLHQHRVAAAVAVEDLFARERDLHRPPEEQRRLGGDDLVVERIGLAAEAAAVGRGDDADLRGRPRRAPWRARGAGSAASASTRRP